MLPDLIGIIMESSDNLVHRVGELMWNPEESPIMEHSTDVKNNEVVMTCKLCFREFISSVA